MDAQSSALNTELMHTYYQGQLYSNAYSQDLGKQFNYFLDKD